MRTMFAGVLALSVALPAGAQAPKPPAANPQAAPQPAVAEKPAGRVATTPEAFTYDSGGRRDPFLSLVGTGTEPRATAVRAEGIAGLTLAEISVRGIMQSRGLLIAMVQGPDNKTHIVHQGDKFVDGTVKSITPQGLVFVQDVNDPLSLVKQRELRKPLRNAEGGKQ
jgi:Tfp pilus assembly protein PilP